ncbi:MAG: signal peptidase I [Nanoarchaeota archaeon]
MKFKILWIFVLIVGIFIVFFIGNTFITGFVITEREISSKFITSDDIRIYEDKLVIDIPNISVSNYASSKSMLPIIDKNTKGIKIKPEFPEQINKGDIITFRKDNKNIVHRVIEKGYDEKGAYFITAGDNNNFNDGKIRFSEIKWITIGILY